MIFLNQFHILCLNPLDTQIISPYTPNKTEEVLIKMTVSDKTSTSLEKHSEVGIIFVSLIGGRGWKGEE